MRFLYGILAIALLVLGTPLFAYPPDCGNNASHGTDKPPCDTCPKDPKSGDPFNPYTGNEYRKVRDLEVWGSVGEIPLVWMRYSNSRFGSYYKYIYGDGSNWNSSFSYNMSDAGLNEQGRPQVFIHYPEGGGAYFAQTASNLSLWLPLTSVTERLFQDGANFYLQMDNGHRYHFQKFILPAGSHYQLQDIRDKYQNIYRLSYDRYGFLSRVTEPAGRYLEVAYQVVASSYYLVGKVTTSDGRSVKYNYNVFNDGVASWVLLTGADYGDGTKATYAYSQTEPGSRPSLEHAIDPRYTGTDVNMRFTYDPANAWGFVKEEINGITGKVMTTLSSEAGKRTVCYANGRVQVYTMPTELLGMVRDYTDGLARKTLYTYYEGSAGQGGPGLLKAETDALGRTTVYNQRTVYGSSLEIIYPDGSKEEWTRDDLDQILTHTDEMGRVTTYTRDNRHRVTRIDYPDGTKDRFSYNSFGQVVTHARRNGGVETSVYNSRGLKTSFIDAEGDITRYTYDGADRLASVTDGRGNITGSEYDERGLLTKSINADGSFQSYGYDEFGNRTSKTNELGNTWKTHYDEFKRHDSITDPLGRLTVYQYDLPGGVCGCSHDNGLPTSITLPSGRMTKIEYDVEWQKIRETVGAGTVDTATTFYEYDLVGNLVVMVDPRMKSWVAEYDVRNRRIRYIDPLGHKKQWMYDYVGNVIRIIRPDMGTTVNQYDAMNRLIQTIDPKMQVTKMKYDEEGNMVKLTDPNNHSYNFEYDLLDRKIRMIYPGGSFERFTYDPVGNLATYTNRSGDVRIYSYDDRNRETSSVWSDNTPAINSSYDAASRLLSMSSIVSMLSYTYNKADELIIDKQDIAGSSGGKSVKYSYNADGLMSSMMYPGGNTVSYNYNGRNQVSSINENGMLVASCSYDANGNRIKKNLYNGTSTIYAYDDANRTLLVDNQKAGISFGRFEYGYDNVDRRTYVKRDNSKGDVYFYDAVDQVNSVHYGVTNPDGTFSNPTKIIMYDWDKVGNRVKVNDNGIDENYITNSRNEYTSINDNLLTYSGGDLKTHNGWTFTYDAQDRLIKAKKGGMILRFDYDSRNRRVKQIVNGVTTYFYYDNWNLIEESNSNSLLSNIYVHGVQEDELLTKSSSTNTVYYYYDALQSVVRLANASGNVLEQYTYDVFGNVGITDGSGSYMPATTFDNRFLFTGRELIQELELYDYRNRMYSARIGRFLQPDPLRLIAGDVNLYRYVKNNPVLWNDPLGLAYDFCILVDHKVLSIKWEIVQGWLGLYEYERGTITRRECTYRCYCANTNNCPDIPCKNKGCPLNHGVEEKRTYSGVGGGPAPGCIEKMPDVVAKGMCL